MTTTTETLAETIARAIKDANTIRDAVTKLRADNDPVGMWCLGHAGEAATQAADALRQVRNWLGNAKVLP